MVVQNVKRVMVVGQEMNLMSKQKMCIWNREFEIPVLYECYSGEEILDSQKEAFALFKDNEQEVELSLQYVKEYVEKNNDGRLKEDISNIFKYVMPKSIFVSHRENQHVVSILCNYKFDIEHGIAVVFENEHFKEVVSQDMLF